MAVTTNSDTELNGFAAGDPGPRLPILLVEDEILIRLASAEWLREAGYAVIEAANPAEAGDILATGQDIALLATDITMPGPIDGLGLARRFRAERPGVPVLLLSARLPVDFHTCADGGLTKPFAPMELVEAVATLIGEPWQTKKDNAGRAQVS